MKLTFLGILCCFMISSTWSMSENAKLFIEDIKNAANTCRNEVKASDVDVEQMYNKMMPTTNEGKCLHLCIMKHFKIIDENGKLLKDVIMSQTNKLLADDPEQVKIAEIIIDECSASTGKSDNKCDVAADHLQCFYNQVDKYKFKDIFSV